MTDADLEQLLDRIVARQVAPLVRLVAALATRMPPRPHDRVLEALGAVYGPGVAFTSADVAEAITLRLESRQALRQALHAALGGKTPTPERIGRLLRSIVAAGGAGWLLTSPATDAGSRIWMLERAGD